MNGDIFQYAREGNVEGISTLLAQGYDVNMRDHDRSTLILLAAQHQQYELVDWLAKHGADINAQNNKCFNPFIHGCIHNDLTLVKQMVELGTDLDCRTRFGGNGLTPAAEKGYEEIVSYLLHHTDINVNLTNNLGWTALIEAIILNDGGKNMQNIIRMLLEHGADPYMSNEWGVMPIDLAREKGYSEIVEIIKAYL